MAKSSECGVRFTLIEAIAPSCDAAAVSARPETQARRLTWVRMPAEALVALVRADQPVRLGL